MTLLTISLPASTQSYRRAGSGRPLVFLHAFPLSSAMWAPQFEAFTPDFDLLALDARGFSASSPFEVAPSVETLAHDLNATLDALGIEEKIVLCGLSMGGYASLAFARLFPARLAGLVLADTRADADTPDGRQARDEMIALASEQGADAVAEKMLPKLLGETTRRDRPDVVELVRVSARAGKNGSIANAVRALRDRPDATTSLASFAFPTLVIGGAEDVPSPPDVMSQMAAQIPGARHVMVPDAGHLSNLEQPEIFNAALREFLSELQG